MLKKIIVILFFVLLSFVFGSEAAEFSKANSLYTDGKYQSALSIYKSIEKLGYKTGPLYYNLGNTYYKLGNILEAKLAYERAYLYIPNDKDLRVNLDLVDLSFVDKAKNNTNYLQVFYDYLKNSFSLNFILFFYIGLFIGFVLLMTIYLNFFKKALLKVILYTFVLVLMVFIFLTFPRVHYFFSRDLALVKSERLEVKSGPSKKLATLFILHKGAKLKIIDRNEDWINIQYDLNFNGWVHKSKIIVI